MINNFIIWLEIFLLCMAILILFKYIYTIIKVIYMKYGKVEMDFIDKLLFSISLSYIISTIITGF